MMGSTLDGRGLEQGSLLGSDQFQLVSNKEHIVANSSGCGVNVGPIHVASAAAADDTVLLSHSQHGIQALIDLSLKFCSKNFMKLVTDKTHLIIMRSKDSKKMVTPGQVSVNNMTIYESL